MAAAFTESISGSANVIPDLNSASSTFMYRMRDAGIEGPRVCAILFLQTPSLHLPTMPRCAQLADNSPSPSNTSYLSGDNWELSGCFLSPLQLIAIVEVIAQTLAPVKTGDRFKRNRWDALKLVCGHRSGDLTAVWIQAPDRRRAGIWGGRTRQPSRINCVRVIG